MLVVSRVNPIMNEDKRKKQKFNFSNLENRSRSQSKRKYSKMNLISTMMIVHKVKFVDTDKIYPTIKEEKDKYSFMKSVSPSEKNPKKLKKIEDKLKCLEKEEQDSIKEKLNNLPKTNMKRQLPSINHLENKISKLGKIQIQENNKLFSHSEKKLNVFNFHNNLRVLKERDSSNSPTNKIKTYTFIIKRGNNKNLIRSILLNRKNWKESSSDFISTYNYKWSNSRKGTDFSLFRLQSNQIKLTNHFEYEHEICNKKYMFINFLEYCENNQINAFEYVPFTIVVKINGSNFRENMKNFEEIFNNIKEYVQSSTSPSKRCSNYSDVFKCDIKNLKFANTKIFIPETHYSGDNLWLVKPTDLYGGKCIHISDSTNEIEKTVKKFYEGIEKKFIDVSESESESEEESKPKLHKYRASTVLLQKYIESPLLYYGRKFDIRMWALIDSEMNLYCFKEGHLKTTSKKYTTKTCDKFVHITNYSMQKHNANFEKFEIGNEVSFQEFQTCLNTEYEGVNLYTHIIPQMHEIIFHTASSIKNKINKKERHNCYLILGYDFMIDKNFKVWLIEVNKNPGLVESSPVLNKLLPRLLDDCFKLTLDKIFDSNYEDTVKYHVENYDDSENMFHHITTLKN